MVMAMDNATFRHIDSSEIVSIAQQHELQVKDPAGSVRLQDKPDTASDRQVRRLCVLGCGDFGRALAQRATQAGFTVHLATRDVNKPKSMLRVINETGAMLCSQQEALSCCDVVVVAVSCRFYDQLPLSLLAGKIVIDVSNNSHKLKLASMLSNAEKLQQMVPTAHVVKAFNVVSAYLLQTGGIQGSKEVPVAGDNAAAVNTVQDLVRELGFLPVNAGPLRSSRKLEVLPLEFFTEWRVAFFVVALIFAAGYLINFVKFQLCKNLTENSAWDWSVFKQLLMTNFNRNLGVVALTVLGAVYLPGVIAAYMQLYRGTKHRRFPLWLDRWLRMRKQLGLLMLMMAATHGCMSLGIFHPDHQGTWLFEKAKTIRTQVMVNGSFEEQDINISYHHTNWRGEVFLTLGAVSLCLLAILGVTSLPSVTASLSWREFTFIQSGLGWTALVAAACHDGVLGGDYMLLYYKCYLPSGLQYALYLPVICVVGKLVLLAPPITRRLENIRAGWVYDSCRVSSA